MERVPGQEETLVLPEQDAGALTEDVNSGTDFVQPGYRDGSAENGFSA
ncbi:MAG: hypothetical protein LKJ45_01575 [Oscillospiraceae bacterium]|nr:hypothetical protein [Oscillospiraceae bacterium]